jgi:hypothetical protein
MLGPSRESPQQHGTTAVSLEAHTPVALSVIRGGKRGGSPPPRRNLSQPRRRRSCLLQTLLNPQASTPMLPQLLTSANFIWKACCLTVPRASFSPFSWSSGLAMCARRMDFDGVDGCVQSLGCAGRTIVLTVELSLVNQACKTTMRQRRRLSPGPR